LEAGVLTALAYVHSANDHRKDPVITSIQNSLQIAVYDYMEDRSSFQRGQNKDACHGVLSSASRAADPVPDVFNCWWCEDVMTIRGQEWH